jgi:hypothetical protein
VRLLLFQQRFLPVIGITAIIVAEPFVGAAKQRFTAVLAGVFRVLSLPGHELLIF